MSNKTWRDVAKQVIQVALEESEAQGMDAEATRIYVNSRYPFGERAYHPYKIWLSEMKRTFQPVADGRSAKAQSDRAKLDAWNAGKPIPGVTDMIIVIHGKE